MPHNHLLFCGRFFAWHVVETKALPKLRRLKTAESLLFEENDPTSRLAQLPSLKRRKAYCCDAEYASQFMQYGLPAQLVAFPHYRPLVPIVELLEQRRGWASVRDEAGVAHSLRLSPHLPTPAVK